MSGGITRRQAVLGLGATTGGGLLAASSADAAAPTVRGTWLITPKSSAGPAGFQALAAFAAGGVFVTTGSDEAGTGLGEWLAEGTDGFAFTYLNFHFGTDGKPSNTVKVRAKGTFGGSRLSGNAALTQLDPNGHRLAPDRHFSFTGQRVAVKAS